MIVLWRDPWIKPLSDADIGTEKCSHCRKALLKMVFVTSCEFCDIGIMHDECANRHILTKHKKLLQAKMSAHKDKPLHDYQ